MILAEVLSSANQVRANNHLIVIGLVTDPLVKALWQREARIEEDRLFIYGFGELSGPVGYIESDRNPFMHSIDVARTPYEM